MNRKLLVTLALATGVAVAAIGWSYYDASRTGAHLLDSGDEVLGQQFAYRLTFPFSDMDQVGLQIRRVSSPKNSKHVIGSVNGDLHISVEDADMIVGTAIVGLTKVGDEILVSTCLVELDEFLADTSKHDEWAIGGRLRIGGSVTRLTPQEGFCQGGSLSTGVETNPHWNNNEICVGRFRAHDEQQIYDYYCVLVATSSKSLPARRASE